MADAHNSSPKARLTRGKAILIAVLGVVLIAILYVQFGRREQASAGQPAAYRPQRRPRATTAAAQPANAANGPAATASMTKEASPAQVIDESRWKSPELAQVITYDPFKLPDTFPHAARVAADGKTANQVDLAAAAEAAIAKQRAEALSKLHSQMKELKQRGASLILRDRDEYVAMIDDRVLHVGDEIDGFTVIAIDDQVGVVIERKDSP